MVIQFLQTLQLILVHFPQFSTDMFAFSQVCHSQAISPNLIYDHQSLDNPLTSSSTPPLFSNSQVSPLFSPFTPHSKFSFLILSSPFLLLLVKNPSSLFKDFRLECKLTPPPLTNPSSSHFCQILPLPSALHLQSTND